MKETILNEKDFDRFYKKVKKMKKKMRMNSSVGFKMRTTTGKKIVVSHKIDMTKGEICCGEFRSTPVVTVVSVDGKSVENTTLMYLYNKFKVWDFLYLLGKIIG